MPALDPTRATNLTAARLDLHAAAQVVSALGASLLPAQDDASHTNLGWDTAIAGLVGRPVEGAQAALLFGPMRWQLWRDGTVLAEQDAAGQTLAQGLAWLRAAAAAHGLPDQPLAAPTDYALPDAAPTDRPLGDSDPADRAQLAAWFSLAHAVLADRGVPLDGVGAPRCWPHHFDLAVSIPLEAASGEEARSLGVGLSPGDSGIDQPYVSVTPWPYPTEHAGPDLPLGAWHTDGWFGAVLRGEQVAAADPHGSLGRFIDAALPAAGRLAGA